MGSKTDYYENAVLNVLRNTAISAIAQCYIALFTVVTNGETSTVTECANANGYARTAVNFAAPSGGSISNNADVTFPNPTGSWGTVVGWAIVDNGTYGAGNQLYYNAQTPNKPIVQDDVVKFLSGTLTISED